MNPHPLRVVKYLKARSPIPESLRKPRPSTNTTNNVRRINLNFWLLWALLPISVSILVWYLLQPDWSQMMCTLDAATGEKVCRPKCEPGSFGLPGMMACYPLLACPEINTDVKVRGALGRGAVKITYLAKWDKFDVVVNTIVAPKYKADFRHGLAMLLALQSHNEVTQLLGYCADTFITEYHKLGTADKLVSTLESDVYSKQNTHIVRFELCTKYVSLLAFLHSSPSGTRVMCDSNDLQKTLSQYLVREDLTLIANDLDALPKANRSNKELIKCGHKQLLGEFVAPEQRWPYPDEPFQDKRMPGYDEKTDIWKIPDVCEHFLGISPETDNIKFHLFKIHKRCKAKNPKKRPTATQILEEYANVYNILK